MDATPCGLPQMALRRHRSYTHSFPGLSHPLSAGSFELCWGQQGAVVAGMLKCPRQQAIYHPILMQSEWVSRKDACNAVSRVGRIGT